MSHEILSAKLSEMDTKLSQLRSRIRSSEQLSDERLQEEIRFLREQVVSEEQLIYDSMLSSKADILVNLRNDIGQLKDRYQCTMESFQEKMKACRDCEEAAEQVTLFAEYGIDFALMAADFSLLLAMEAMAADRNKDKENE